MTNIRTGQTVYEIIQSFDQNNNPVTGVTFDVNFYVGGVLNNSIVPEISLVNPSAATYSISWSSNTLGFHQYYAKNNSTNVLYISELYDVRMDLQPVVYVGL